MSKEWGDLYHHGGRLNDDKGRIVVGKEIGKSTR